MSDGPDILHDFRATAFGGIPAAQFWIDFVLWENLLNDNPQVRAIVEIGTWEGGFSWYLWSQAHVRGLGFQTFDVIDPQRTPPPGFNKADVWAILPELQESLPAWGPIVLFCDGGNKPRELATLPSMCAPGSVFVVHDWGSETLPEDVPDGLVEMYGDWCDTVGSITRVFVDGS